MTGLVLKMAWLIHTHTSQAFLNIHRLFRDRLKLMLLFELTILAIFSNVAMTIPGLWSGTMTAQQWLLAVLAIRQEHVSLSEVVFGHQIPYLNDWLPIIVALSCSVLGIILLDWVRGFLDDHHRHSEDSLDPRIAAWGIIIGIGLHILLAAILMDYFQRGNVGTLLYAVWPWILAYMLLIFEGGRGGRRRRESRQEKSWLQLLRDRVFGELAPQQAG